MALYHLCKRNKECAGLIGYSGLLYENERFSEEISLNFNNSISGKKDQVIDYNFTLKAYQKLNELGSKLILNLVITLDME